MFQNESQEQIIIIIIQIYLLKGIAFLPTFTNTPTTDINSSSSSSSLLPSLQINPDDFEWRQVNIIRYNETTNKWHVQASVGSGSGGGGGTIYEVPRIYLMFITEDRMKFAQRIQRAVQLRDNSECYLRFEAFLNGFGMEKIPQPSDHIHNCMRKFLARQCSKQFNEDWIEFYQREYTIVYQKFHAVMYLEKFIEEQRKKSNSSSSSSSGIQIQLPRRQERKLKNLLPSQMQQQQQHHRGRNEIMGKVENFCDFSLHPYTKVKNIFLNTHQIFQRTR